MRLFATLAALLSMPLAAHAAEGVRLEVTLTEGGRSSRRTLLVVPGKGFAVLRPAGLVRQVVWLQTAHHVWRWTPGSTSPEKGRVGYPVLPRRPWRARLAPWGRLLALRELDPARYPIAHWLLFDRHAESMLPRAWRRATDRGQRLRLREEAFRTELARLIRRFGPRELRPPAALSVDWRTDAGRLGEVSWRILWGHVRSAGRLRVTATQRVAGLTLPRTATLERRCRHPRRHHVLATTQVRVAATPYRGQLPEPPPALSRGPRFDRPDWLQQAVARQPDDPHLRRRLAEALGAAHPDRKAQVDWLARHGQGTEARILNLRGATVRTARLEILRERLRQAEAGSLRDLAVGLAIDGPHDRPYRELLDQALTRFPRDVSLNTIRWSLDTNALRTLRRPRLRAALAAARVRLLASPETPLRLLRDLLHDISVKGRRAATEHLRLWRARPRERLAPLRRDLVMVTLCGWARTPEEAREASRRLSRRLTALRPAELATETLYLLFGLVLPELAPLDRQRVIAHLSQSLPRVEPRWQTRWIGLILLALRTPQPVAAWLAGMVRADPARADRLLTPERMSWLEHPDRVLRALPDEPALVLLRARLAIRANRMRDAFSALWRLVRTGSPGEGVLDTYGTLLLHGPALPIEGAPRPDWLPPGSWMASKMAAELFDQAIARHPRPRLMLDAALLARATGRPHRPLMRKALDRLLTEKGPLDPARRRLAGRLCGALFSEKPVPLGALSTATACRPLLPDEAGLWLALATGGSPVDLTRLSWALERALASGAWRVPAIGKAVEALAAGPQARALADLPDRGPIGRHLRVHLLLARKRPKAAQTLLARLLADWPDSPALWTLQLRLQETNRDWSGLARTLRTAGRWLDPRQRRDLMVKAVRGLLAGHQLPRAVLLAEQFCRQHPRHHLFTSSAPLVALLQAGQLAAFEKLFPIWDRRRDSSSTRLKIELLMAGKRPFEAYGLLRKLDPAPEALMTRFTEKFGEGFAFQYYLRETRFPEPKGEELDLQLSLLRRLGHSSFAIRRRAERRLSKMGERAGHILLQGTRSKDLEVRRRCAAILRRLFEEQRKR